MVTDKQVRLLMKFYHTERSLCRASAKAGMDEKTALKYLRSGTLEVLETGKLPSELKVFHTWRTRDDPFEEVSGRAEVIIILYCIVFCDYGARSFFRFPVQLNFRYFLDTVIRQKILRRAFFEQIRCVNK